MGREVLQDLQSLANCNVLFSGVGEDWRASALELAILSNADSNRRDVVQVFVPVEYDRCTEEASQRSKIARG